MTRQEKAAALQRTQLFGAIAAESLWDLAGNALERRMKQNEVLFMAGDSAQGLFVIVSGSLRAFRESHEGREQTIHVERAGATLAEVPLFDNGAYPSTVTAEEDAVILFLAKDDVRQFLLQNPSAALSALGILAGRLRRVAALAESLSLQDVAQRLAAMLIEEAIKQGGDLRDGVSFSLPFSHQKLAADLGSVREVITRNLHKLVNERIIEIRGHRIVVLHAAALQARAESN